MPVPVARSQNYIRDVLAIWDYVSQQSASSADRVVREIEGRVDMLGDFPDMGERTPEFGPHCRRVLASSYAIYYERQLDFVEVLRALHSARDISSLERFRG